MFLKNCYLNCKFCGQSNWKT